MFLCKYFENIIKHQITLNILLPLLEEHSLITYLLRMLIKVQSTFLLSWDWTKESTEVKERCCTDQVKYDILQQSTASSTNVQDWELAWKLCSVQILCVHLYHYPICIINILKQVLKQCRHHFQINVAWQYTKERTKNISEERRQRQA